jgi:transcription elongation factor Elf1
MGLPTRLHGDAVAEFFGAVKGFCPRCSSMREWTVSKDEDGEKYYKKCKKCGQKKEIREPELSQLAEAANTRQPQKDVKKKD